MIGKIYKLTPHKCCEFYIGSTFDMERREKRHRTDGKNRTYKIYEKIREMGGFDMELLYEYECENETELRMEEQRCIDNMKPKLNSYRAYNNEEDKLEYKKQYYEQNKDVLNENQKQYNEQNKAKILAKKKEYREENREVILAKKKEYNEQNKEVMRVKRKQHYEQNNDKAKKYYEQNKAVLNEKITCECGCVVVKRILNRHKQSNKHIKLMEQQTIMG